MGYPLSKSMGYSLCDAFFIQMRGKTTIWDIFSSFWYFVLTFLA